MIENRQIRAARALLDWSQADLARAAGIATSSVKNIESAFSTPRKETLDHIRTALDAGGVEFTPGTGVRLKSDIIAVHDGRRATSELLASIQRHAPLSSDREVCIIGLDETFSLETDGADMLRAHVTRLSELGVRERILICEGDTRYLNAPECYRWLPRKYFTRQSPIYVYGDHIAIHSGSLRRRTIIIEAKPLAQHLRMLFGLLWNEIAFAPRVMNEARAVARR